MYSYPQSKNSFHDFLGKQNYCVMCVCVFFMYCTKELQVNSLFIFNTILVTPYLRIEEYRRYQFYEHWPDLQSNEFLRIQILKAEINKAPHCTINNTPENRKKLLLQQSKVNCVLSPLYESVLN